MFIFRRARSTVELNDFIRTEREDVSMACAQPIYECPVCWDDYVEPKFLHCGHLVCQKCVLAWLGKKGSEASCPVCLASIERTDGLDPVSVVKALPTDLHTAALVESHQILQGPRICSLCEDDVAACSYCVQCGLKLCTKCAKGHRKIPATYAHTLADFDNLSVEKLAETRPVTCEAHPDKLAELYCLAHRGVICVLCSTTSHAACANKIAMTDMATMVRKYLNQQIQKLKLKERELAVKVRAAEERHKTLHLLSHHLLDNLLKAPEEQDRDFIKYHFGAEWISKEFVPALVKAHAAFTQSVTTIGRLAEGASDGVLLQMIWKLRKHLDYLEAQAEHPWFGRPLWVPGNGITLGDLMRSD